MNAKGIAGSKVATPQNVTQPIGRRYGRFPVRGRRGCPLGVPAGIPGCVGRFRGQSVVVMIQELARRVMRRPARRAILWSLSRGARGIWSRWMVSVGRCCCSKAALAFFSSSWKKVGVTALMPFHHFGHVSEEVGAPSGVELRGFPVEGQAGFLGAVEIFRFFQPVAGGFEGFGGFLHLPVSFHHECGPLLVHLFPHPVCWGGLALRDRGCSASHRATDCPA